MGKRHIQSWQIHIFNRGKDTFLNLNCEKYIYIHPAPLHQQEPIAHYALLCNVCGRWRVAEGSYTHFASRPSTVVAMAFCRCTSIGEISW